MGPHVDLLVGVHTGQDEEDPRAPGSSYQQSAESEDDSSLVLLGRHFKPVLALSVRSKIKRTLQISIYSQLETLTTEIRIFHN